MVMLNVTAENAYLAKHVSRHVYWRFIVLTESTHLAINLLKLHCIAELKKELMMGVGDSLVDITGFEDSCLDEGYGSAATASTVQPSSNIVHQNMIKRYVLKV